MLMSTFVDIHCHALFGVDDGAPDEATMYEMLRMAYLDGTRAVCLTPHCDPDRPPSQVQVAEAFSKAEAYCQQNLPDMELYLGNELTYCFECVDMLARKECRTMAESRYVLVDFFTAPVVTLVLRAIDTLLNAGYLPIVAHVERYSIFGGKIKEIARLIEAGALIQVNADSFLQGPLSPVGITARRLLSERMIDLIASDGHDAVMRTPTLGEAYRAVQKRSSKEYADILFTVNPRRVLSGEKIQ